MKPKKQHRAKNTSGQVNDALAQVIGEESRFISWNRRVGRIKVDGVPLNALRARFKRPDDVVYHKQTHEALMGADIVAGLGLDEEVVNVTSRDNPDLVLHFRDGANVYAEFTRACIGLDEANNETIRNMNRRLRNDLAANPPMNWKGKFIAPHITLHNRPENRIAEDDFFQEILIFIRGFDGKFGSMGRFESNSPILASLGAEFWWYESKFNGRETVVNSMFESRDLRSLVRTIEKCISEKTGRYPHRPLWLFIAISESWANCAEGGAYIALLKAARKGLLKFGVGDFDRVAVGVNGTSVWLKSNKSET